MPKYGTITAPVHPRIEPSSGPWAASPQVVLRDLCPCLRSRWKRPRQETRLRLNWTSVPMLAGKAKRSCQISQPLSKRVFWPGLWSGCWFFVSRGDMGMNSHWLGWTGCKLISTSGIMFPFFWVCPIETHRHMRVSLLGC